MTQHKIKLKKWHSWVPCIFWTKTVMQTKPWEIWTPIGAIYFISMITEDTEFVNIEISSVVGCVVRQCCCTAKWPHVSLYSRWGTLMNIIFSVLSSIARWSNEVICQSYGKRTCPMCISIPRKMRFPDKLPLSADSSNPLKQTYLNAANSIPF